MVVGQVIGFGMKIKAIGIFLIGILLIAFGVYISYINTAFGEGFGNSIYALLAFIGAGLFAFLASWLYWKYAKRVSRIGF